MSPDCLCRAIGLLLDMRLDPDAGNPLAVFVAQTQTTTMTKKE